MVSKITSNKVDLISAYPSGLAKCPFVKQRCPPIEMNFYFVWNIFITSLANMFYDMRYNDAYAKHVNIRYENKKLNWDVTF